MSKRLRQVVNKVNNDIATLDYNCDYDIWGNILETNSDVYAFIRQTLHDLKFDILDIIQMDEHYALSMLSEIMTDVIGTMTYREAYRMCFNKEM